MRTRLTCSATRYSLLAPTVMVGALVGPNAIFIADMLTDRSSKATALHAVAPSGLLVAGMTLTVIGVVFAVYRWTLARRLLHVASFFILLEVFYRIAYRGPVTPGLLLAVPQTSRLETLELLAGHAVLTASLSVAALLCAFALAIAWRKPLRLPLVVCCRISALGVVLLLGALVSKASLFGATSLPTTPLLTVAAGTYPMDVALSFGAVTKDVYRASRRESLRQEFMFKHARLRDSGLRKEREAYVIVVGETSRRQNWSLFGYARPTNPNLLGIAPDLVLYRMMSNATNTVLSLPMVLTRATPETRDRIGTEKSIVSLLKQSGFDTFWISNQERPALSSNPILKIATEADHVSFREEGIRGRGTDRFDTNLVERLSAALDQMPTDGKAVIFLHMEGSHFSYKERYPLTFKRFLNAEDVHTDRAVKQQRMIDQYDNTLVFTDYVLSQVIRKLSLCNCAAGMLFFSDHGERLFDGGSADSAFGHGFPGIARQEVEVPFVAWLSPKFQLVNPALSRQLRINANWVAELHDVFETIVDLAGVDYDDRAATLSLFSDGWQQPSAVSVLGLDDTTVMLPVG